MKSILENKVLLKEKINEVAEVAGYLWQKGWAERNGGNITLNITEWVDEEMKNLPSLTQTFPIGNVLPNLKGCYFFCKGNNKRMRDLSRSPMNNGSIIRILDDCSSYEIIADSLINPTSELPSHLSIHNYLIGKGSNYKAALHTHPTELVAMTHNPIFLEKDILTDLLWSMIPETRAFCPRGLGIVPYKLPGSFEIAQATINELEDYDVVMWEKHGVFSVSENIIEAFDMVDTLVKSAQIYMISKAMGFEPEGMKKEDMKILKETFNLPK